MITCVINKVTEVVIVFFYLTRGFIFTVNIGFPVLPPNSPGKVEYSSWYILLSNVQTN